MWAPLPCRCLSAALDCKTACKAALDRAQLTAPSEAAARTSLRFRTARRVGDHLQKHRGLKQGRACASARSTLIAQGPVFVTHAAEAQSSFPPAHASFRHVGVLSTPREFTESCCHLRFDVDSENPETLNHSGHHLRGLLARV